MTRIKLIHTDYNDGFVLFEEVKVGAWLLVTCLEVRWIQMFLPVRWFASRRDSLLQPEAAPREQTNHYKGSSRAAYKAMP